MLPPPPTGVTYVRVCVLRAFIGRSGSFWRRVADLLPHRLPDRGALTTVHNCAKMPDPKPDSSPVTQNPEEKAEAPAEAPAGAPSQPDKDILEVTAMEQSPEQDSPNEVEEAAEPPEKAEPEPEPPLPPEFDKYWKAVEANPEDFTTWTYLLHYVEQENHIYASRRVFDMFLARYPYCYGYWKKYADLEKRCNNVMEADEVYRRGIQAITLSVDLWIHYLQFLKETLDPADPETANTLRGTFEHSIMSAGLDFRSDKLWEMYITYETELGNLSGVTSIYSRLLGIPTQLYAHHFQRFKEHIQGHLPKEFLTAEKFIELRKELASVNHHGGSKMEYPSGLEDIADPAQRTTEVENMRHRIIEVHQEIFNTNENEVHKRWAFEEGIKRPYFHVKPLERVQINNWKEYLDYEMENGSHERVVILFERCVIACACYEEFWIKYAKYMEHHSPEGARHVYTRACNIHLLKKPLAHLLWSGFEEQQGNTDEARRILKTLEESVDSLATVRLRRVNLERRHGNIKEAEELLTESMKNSKATHEFSFYAIKLSRFYVKILKNAVKARKVLNDALQKDKENTKIYLNLIDLEFSGDVKQNESNILVLFDKVIKSSMPLATRITFSQRKVEFLEDFGSDINKLLTSYDDHQKLLREQEIQKRKAENGLEQPDAKRLHSEDSAVMSAAPMAATTTAAVQPAYNYANWYQQQQQQQYSYQNAWNYGQYYHPPST
ncbi:pre-mRNA-processing factor 39 isoform X2 [Hyla sarda]|uniref:pre-mRNA-processing factor 39 isoform X2 n=1 Tax=Hyla sarda TaxID=327740 RepID=UPI0024C3BED1|nr:pre-mRNA-processing factor 39 isoform X2 [Hyla sarda]